MAKLEPTTAPVAVRSTNAFDKAKERLPPEIRELADFAMAHPREPMHRLKKLKPFKLLGWPAVDYYSVRVSNLKYRAVCTIGGNDDFTWHWIGTHEDFDRRFGSAKN